MSTATNDPTDEIQHHAHMSWRLLTAPNPTEEDAEKVILWFSETVAQSESTRALIQEELSPKQFLDILSLASKGRVIKKWQHLMSGPMPDDRSGCTAFLRDFMELLGGQTEKVLRHRNLAATNSYHSSSFVQSSVQRGAGTHSGWSLHLTVRGEGNYDCIRQQYVAGPGDLVLLGPDAVYDYAAVDDEIWEYHWIYFQPDPRIIEWLNWRELGPNIYHVKLTSAELPHFASLMIAAQDLNPQFDEIDRALFFNLVEHLFIRSQKCVDRKQVVFRDSRVNDAKAYILEHLDRPFTVVEVAQSLGLSRTQLSVLFKRATGQSILNWANDRRMALAVQMLLQTDHSVATIADELGFEDALYFSRKFKSYMGKSPRNYRKFQAERLLS